MTKAKAKAKPKAKVPPTNRVEWPKHGIKTAGMARTSTGVADGIRYVIDPSEKQVIDNRGGPRLSPPRKRTKPTEEQTTWLK